MPTRLPSSSAPVVVAILDRRTIDANNLPRAEKNARQREWINKVQTAASQALNKVIVLTMRDFHGLIDSHDITKEPNTEDTVVYHHLGLAFIAVEDRLDEQDILEILAPAKEEEAGCYMRLLLPRYDKACWKDMQSRLVAVRDQIKAGSSFEVATDDVFGKLPYVTARKSVSGLSVWESRDVSAAGEAMGVARVAKAQPSKMTLSERASLFKHKTTTPRGQQETYTRDRGSDGARDAEVAALHSEIMHLKQQVADRDRRIDELGKEVLSLKMRMVKDDALLNKVAGSL